MSTFKKLIILLLVFSVNTVLVISDCSVLDKYLYIRHKETRLVLASIGFDVQLQTYDPSPVHQQYQQWIFHLSPRTGLFIVHIQYSTGALDFDKDTYELARYDETNSIYQDWFFNADGTIVNGALYGHAISINRTEFGEIDKIYLAPIGTPGAEQIFELLDAHDLEEQSL